LTSRALAAEVSEAGLLLTMHYVYLIQSISCPDQRYVGVTSDLKGRLKTHNEGRSPQTSKYKPWKLVTYLGFSDESKAAEFETWELITYLAFKDKSTAIAFEKYLKSHSGKAFANKRLW
jgi:predicted GIY-YIG superfamily endonuclease